MAPTTRNRGKPNVDYSIMSMLPLSLVADEVDDSSDLKQHQQTKKSLALEKKTKNTGPVSKTKKSLKDISNKKSINSINSNTNNKKYSLQPPKKHHRQSIMIRIPDQDSISIYQDEKKYLETENIDQNQIIQDVKDGKLLSTKAFPRDMTTKEIILEHFDIEISERTSKLESQLHLSLASFEAKCKAAMIRLPSHILEMNVQSFLELHTSEEIDSNMGINREVLPKFIKDESKSINLHSLSQIPLNQDSDIHRRSTEEEMVKKSALINDNVLSKTKTGRTKKGPPPISRRPPMVISSKRTTRSQSTNQQLVGTPAFNRHLPHTPQVGHYPYPSQPMVYTGTPATLNLPPYHHQQHFLQQQQQQHPYANHHPHQMLSSIQAREPLSSQLLPGFHNRPSLNTAENARLSHNLQPILNRPSLDNMNSNQALLQKPKKPRRITLRSNRKSDTLMSIMEEEEAIDPCKSTLTLSLDEETILELDVESATAEVLETLDQNMRVKLYDKFRNVYNQLDSLLSRF